MQPLSNKVKRAERVIEKLEQKKQEIEQQLANTELYQDEHKDKLKQLLTDQTYIQKELDQAENEWMEASEALEQAKA